MAFVPFLSPIDPDTADLVDRYSEKLRQNGMDDASVLVMERFHCLVAASARKAALLLAGRIAVQQHGGDGPTILAVHGQLQEKANATEVLIHEIVQDMERLQAEIEARTDSGGVPS